MTQSLNKPTNEKILPPFFIYPLLPLRVCVHTCVCVCSPCPNDLCNLCLFSALFWKVVFLPLPYSPASWMAACAVSSGPQVTVLCTNPQNCVEPLSSREQTGSKPPSLPFLFHPSRVVLRHGLGSGPQFIWPFIHPSNSQRAAAFRPEKVGYCLAL